jgi:hypothetical protein
MLVSAGAIVLMVSLFVNWYGVATAWEAFEVVDVLLAALGLAAVIIAAGLLAAEFAYLDRRWLPAVVLAALVLVVAELLDRPPTVTGDRDSGAWLALAAVGVMVLGAALTLGRIRVAVAVEGRDLRHRVPAVDHRQPTTETAAIADPSEPSAPAAAPGEPDEPHPGEAAAPGAVAGERGPVEAAAPGAVAGEPEPVEPKGRRKR